MYTFYKYLNQKYLKSFLGGQILIRPLAEFRKAEEYGAEIGDSNEGKVKFLTKGKSFDTSDPNHNKSLAHAISGTIQAGQIVIEASETINIATNNCFIFSVSQVKASAVANKMNRDTCVEIAEFGSFFKDLTDCLLRKGYKVKLDQALVKDCLYVDRVFDLQDGLPDAPAFLKEKKHEYQKEVRCAWIIENTVEGAIVVECPELKKYFKIVNL